MRRILAIAAPLAAALLLLSSAGCANPRGSSGDYYRRGSIHEDSFPADYVPGRYRVYGRHGW